MVWLIFDTEGMCKHMFFLRGRGDKWSESKFFREETSFTPEGGFFGMDF